MNKETYFGPTAAEPNAGTGCAHVCESLGRLGEEGTCMPADPECVNYKRQEDWPIKGNGQSRTVSIGTYCMCGPLDRAQLEVQSARVVVGPVRPADTSTASLDGGRRLFDGVNATLVADRDLARMIKHTEQTRRRTQDIISTGTDVSSWTWDQPSISAGIDSYHGNHLAISDQCLEDSYSWKVRHVREDFK